jgi:hypothetical protein
MAEVGGATTSSRTETVMISLIVIGALALAYSAWLLLTLSVYALPLFVGVTSGLAAYQSSSGVPGAVLIGSLAAALALAAIRRLFSATHAPAARALAAAIFVLPAGYAGYHAAFFGLARLTDASLIWQQALALIGAIAIGALAWARIAYPERQAN